MAEVGWFPKGQSKCSRGGRKAEQAGARKDTSAVGACQVRDPLSGALRGTQLCMNCCDSPREERGRLQAGPRLQAASAVQTTSGRRHKGTGWVLSEEQPREEASQGGTGLGEGLWTSLSPGRL